MNLSTIIKMASERVRLTTPPPAPPMRLKDKGIQDTFLLTGIIALDLGVRLVFAFITKSWSFPAENNFWEFGYEMGWIASSLAAGGGFSWPTNPPVPTALMPPVYPIIIAAVFYYFGVFSEHAAAVLEFFQAIISAVTCVLLYILGKRIYNAQSGLLSALCYAIYPAAIFFTVGVIWSTSLFVCCFLVVILLFLRLQAFPSVKGGGGLGVALGLTALVDPAIIGIYPFALVWLYRKIGTGREAAIKVISVVVITFGLSISPWLVRNYVAFGKFVFVKSNLGAALYLGNNEKADGRYYRQVQKELNGGITTSLLSENERYYVRHVDEVSRNAFYFQKAFVFITEHPFRFVQLTLKRVVLFWTSIRETKGWQEKVAMSAYFFILVCAIGGFWLSQKGNAGVQLILFVLLSFPLLYYFTIVGIYRYRFPVEPILMIFAGYAVHRVLCQRNRSMACSLSHQSVSGRGLTKFVTVHM